MQTALLNVWKTVTVLWIQSPIIVKLIYTNYHILNTFIFRRHENRETTRTQNHLQKHFNIYAPRGLYWQLCLISSTIIINTILFTSCVFLRQHWQLFCWLPCYSWRSGRKFYYWLTDLFEMRHVLKLFFCNWILFRVYLDFCYHLKNWLHRALTVSDKFADVSM